MHLSAIQDVDYMPSIGTLFGEMGGSELASRLSTQSGVGGVIFGHAGDPMANRYNKFRNTVTNVIVGTTKKILNTFDVIMRRDKPVLLSCEEDLTKIPMCMRTGLLTYAPIRKLLDESQIHGFGIKPEWLPEEDVVGRLINNGRVEEYYDWEKKQWRFPDHMEWTWKDDDPDFDDDQLTIFEASRNYMEQFILRQMSEDGENLDPTDFGEGATIGDLE